MKRVSSLVLSTLLSTTLYAANPVNGQNPAVPVVQQPRLLFVIMANSGEIKPLGNNQYQVVLQDVKPTLVRFTDAPLKDASRMALSDFVDYWLAHNDVMKPNVAIEGLVAEQGKEVEDNYVFSLQNPQYNEKDKTLSYQATLLGKNKLDHIAKMNDVTVFVDDIPGGGSWIG